MIFDLKDSERRNIHTMKMATVEGFVHIEYLNILISTNSI